MLSDDAIMNHLFVQSEGGDSPVLSEHMEKRVLRASRDVSCLKFVVGVVLLCLPQTYVNVGAQGMCFIFKFASAFC